MISNDCVPTVADRVPDTVNVSVSRVPSYRDTDTHTARRPQCDCVPRPRSRTLAAWCRMIPVPAQAVLSRDPRAAAPNDRGRRIGPQTSARAPAGPGEATLSRGATGPAANAGPPSARLESSQKRLMDRRTYGGMN